MIETKTKTNYLEMFKYLVLISIRMDEETISDFVFDEHVSRMDSQSVKKALMNRPLEKILGLIFEINLDKLTSKTANDLAQGFDTIRDFFLNMESQKYCQVKNIIKYSDGKIRSNNVNIYGTGMESFNINGTPEFHISKDNLQKKTIIPVEKKGDEFNIIIYNHPSVEIPSITEKIDIHYDFKTWFSLGDCYSDFTKNPLKTQRDLERSHTDYFFGEPGKLKYRMCDAFWKELNESIFGKMLYITQKRDRFNLSGKIYTMSKDLLYQGSMDSSGTFPFFIRKDSDDKAESRIRPRSPKSEVLVE